jgi:hypothetical protein
MEIPEMKILCFLPWFILFVVSCIVNAQSASREEQLKDLQTKQILVAMWGWPVEEMAPAAKRFGYQVVNQPQNNDLESHKKDVPIWEEHGLKMLVRPRMETYDPFDAEDVKRGIEKVNEVIRFHRSNPNVVGFVIQWGQYGEGGFPWGYTFTEKAKDAFNSFMNTPGEPLPEAPAIGIPGSMRWVKWQEFRSKTLRDFRTTYIAAFKQQTDKLVGTWSEVYPTEHYSLNMGDAPGSDFLFYDLSFGDVTTNQRIAFGENHGGMELFPTYEKWRNGRVLPLMAKAAGEGVIPISFQFPMRRGYEASTARETRSIDNIEDEYSLRIGSEIRKLIDGVDGRVREPQVALVYNSFSAAALPGGTPKRHEPSRPIGGAENVVTYPRVLQFYENRCAKQIEGLIHQLGVDYRVIPYEWLEDKDLSGYKIVIIPDPLYLNEAMSKNLKNAKRVLYAGEYLMAHRNPATEKGDYLKPGGFAAETELGEEKIHYFMAPEGKLNAASQERHRWLKTIDFSSEHLYPSDQMCAFSPIDSDCRVVLKVGSQPVILEKENGNQIFITNRFFHNGWNMGPDWLEKIQYTFLRNLFSDSGVDVRVASDSRCRVKTAPWYGSYGLSGYVAWNFTENDIDIVLDNGRKLTIPRIGWTLVVE